MDTELRDTLAALGPSPGQFAVLDPGDVEQRFGPGGSPPGDWRGEDQRRPTPRPVPTTPSPSSFQPTRTLEPVLFRCARHWAGSSRRSRARHGVAALEVELKLDEMPSRSMSPA
jgi:hypothetical protein